MLEPRGLDAGWAKLEELRAEILAFKQSGKPVYAYLRNATMREYYLATAADKIYMAPEDELDVKGLRAELMYFKGTLDKLGVSMEFEHVGKYKDAPDTFTKTSPSPETLEVTNQILDQYYGNMVQVIADGRKLPPGAVRGVIDQGPFIGKSALDSGLVDGLIFEDEMLAQLNTQLKTDLKKIGARSYSKAAGADPSGRARIAYVTGDGEITRGDPGEDVSDSGITAFGMVKQLRQVADDSSIKGVILRVDSPGGDGIASDDILHEMKAAEQEEAGADFDVRPGGFRRILHRHDRRSGAGLLQYAHRLHRRVLRQGEPERAVRQDRPQERTADARALRGHRFGDKPLTPGGKGQGSERDPGVLSRLCRARGRSAQAALRSSGTAGAGPCVAGSAGQDERTGGRDRRPGSRRRDDQAAHQHPRVRAGHAW